MYIKTIKYKGESIQINKTYEDKAEYDVYVTNKYAGTTFGLTPAFSFVAEIKRLIDRNELRSLFI